MELINNEKTGSIIVLNLYNYCLLELFKIFYSASFKFIPENLSFTLLHWRSFRFSVTSSSFAYAQLRSTEFPLSWKFLSLCPVAHIALLVFAAGIHLFEFRNIVAHSTKFPLSWKFLSLCPVAHIALLVFAAGIHLFEFRNIVAHSTKFPRT